MDTAIVKCTYANLYDTPNGNRIAKITNKDFMIGDLTGNSRVADGKLYLEIIPHRGIYKTNVPLWVKKVAVNIYEDGDEDETTTEKTPKQNNSNKGLLLGLAALLFMDF